MVDEPYFALFRRMVFILDNPDHRRIRQLFTGIFSLKRVTGLRAQVEDIANQLLDPFSDVRRMDLIADFAKPLPTRVIGELLGVPEADQIRIGDLAGALNPLLEFLPMSPGVLVVANNAVIKLAQYFRDLAATKRAQPGDDLYTAIVHTADGAGLDGDELIANAIIMYIGGHETTAGAIGLAVLALHRNPEQLAMLKADPNLRSGAVDELLRYDAPGQATGRVPMEPVTFGDTTIPPGNGVVAYIRAANRDPAAYANPDALDIRCIVESPTSFGGGAHYCIGHSLARRELEVALGTLLRRRPDMQFATLDPRFRPTPLMRDVAELQVAWYPAHWCRHHASNSRANTASLRRTPKASMLSCRMSPLPGNTS